MVHEFGIYSETAETLVAASGQDSDVVSVVDVTAIAGYGSVFFDESFG
jgi:H+/gluconate symporter-like permease